MTIIDRDQVREAFDDLTLAGYDPFDQLVWKDFSRATTAHARSDVFMDG